MDQSHGTGEQAAEVIRRTSPPVSGAPERLADQAKAPVGVAGVSRRLPCPGRWLANPLAVTRLVASSCMSVGSLVSPSTGVRSG
jgi:hypothetical protein